MLTPGTQFGHYEIQALIGRGGMGEVYRAQDLRLMRHVAVKVLPSAVAADAGRLARFEREAQMLAALSHPRIAGVYGLEESGGTRALVMELVDGETLAERIAPGPIPLEEALAIARQVAEALEAAHDAGIIHRDLKPANIKVRPDGSVKVLDFGLAKAMEPSPSSPGLADSPTRTTPAPMTHAGEVLGTVAYMPPEQARGKVVTRRADVWAFGCVLFEMLSGIHPFAGATVPDTMAAVLGREPPWNRLPPGTPAAARRLLRRCLEKNADDRLRDIGDAGLELADAMRETTDAADGAPPASAAGHGWRIASALAILAVAAAAGLAYDWLGPGRRPVTLPVAAPPVRLTYDAALTSMPAVSPDGRLVAYASDRSGRGDRDIWVQQTSGGAPLRLTDEEADDSQPTFSPDGREIAFRSERRGGGIYVVPALGGSARLLVEGGRMPRFAPDGSHLAFVQGQFRGSPSTTSSALHVLPLNGGASTRLVPDFEGVFSPLWSPDGRAVLALARRDRTAPIAGSFDWWWIPVDGSAPIATGVLDDPALRSAEAAPSAWWGTEVLFSDEQNLRAVPISTTTGRATGPARWVTSSGGSYQDPAVSPDGSILFVALTRERVIARIPLAGDDEASRLPYPLHTDGQSTARRASTTRDGSQLAFERRVLDHTEIWIKSLAADEQRQLIRLDTRGQLNVTISPDGTRVAYTIMAENPARAGYVLSTSGGTPRQVCTDCLLFGFLADNRRVLAEADNSRALRIYDTDGFQDLVAVDQGILSRPHASPDDRWLAFRLNMNAATRSYLVPLTPGRPAPRSSWAPIDEPTSTGRPAGWSLDSTVMYLLLDTDGFRCLWAQRIDPRTGRPLGLPSAVRHFHGAQISVAGGVSSSFGNAISTAGFTFETIATKGDLWRLPPG